MSDGRVWRSGPAGAGPIGKATQSVFQQQAEDLAAAIASRDALAEQVEAVRANGMHPEFTRGHQVGYEQCKVDYGIPDEPQPEVPTDEARWSPDDESDGPGQPGNSEEDGVGLSGAAVLSPPRGPQDHIDHALAIQSLDDQTHFAAGYNEARSDFRAILLVSSRETQETGKDDTPS